MEKKDELLQIRTALELNVGKRVCLTARKGKKKSVVRQGTIENTFPSIFTVKIENGNGCATRTSRIVSYSYTDILTKAIEIAQC
ncbi:MAG: Veg protein [Clostridiaceae bacterium]|jgi:uncharacterized protein Veg|nr:Veg protein [Clostridiaceae bacterium]